MRLALFLTVLSACEPVTDKADPTWTDTGGEGEGEGEVEPPPTYDIHAAELVYALPWAAGDILYGGYSMVGGDRGLYIADAVSDGTAAYIYRLPWGKTAAATIEGAAEIVISTDYFGPDRMGFHDGWLSIPNAAATVGDATLAGIAYELREPDASGELFEMASIAVEGDTEDGYVGRSLRLDADLDGEADDLVVSKAIYERAVHGELAVFLNIVEGSTYPWSSADFVLRTCIEDDGAGALKWGASDLDVDATGTALWVTCPAPTDVAKLEQFALPLVADAVPYGYVAPSGGRFASVDPRGGAWSDLRVGGAVQYVAPDLSYVANVYPPEAEEDLLFGASPQVIETAGGQVFLLVGSQAADVIETLAPPPDGGTEATSGVYLCDVDDLPEYVEGEATPTLTDCASYGVSSDSGVTSIGAVQALVETDDGLYLASSGWVYGTGTAGGVQVWRIPATE